MGELQELNYKNLMDAVADNAASVRKLQAGRSTMVVTGCSAAAAFLLTITGIARNAAPHARGWPPLMVGRPGNNDRFNDRTIYRGRAYEQGDQHL